jgi:hypothetical protein
MEDLANIYLRIIEEGIEEKIPKLLNLVKPEIEDKESYIRWAAETFDPTKGSSYITWILRMLKSGSIVGEEDSQKVRERLEQFEEIKKKPQFPKEKRDINSYKNYGDLAETLDEYRGVQTKGEMKRSATERGIQFVGSSTDKEGMGITLYIVTTSEAGAKYFRETEWCVKDPRYFDNYRPPYYFFTLNGSPHKLLHLDSEQCMDVRDRPTDLNSAEIALMESEEMTDYVLQNDNSDSSLFFYMDKVGYGYDEKIDNIVRNKIEKIVDDANRELEIFIINEPDYDDLKYYRPSAYGSIEYDFEKYEEHIEDSKFLKILNEVLSDVGIYTSSYYEITVSDELDRVSFNVSEEEYYTRRENNIDYLEEFVSGLKGMERNFDPERFDENLTDSMLEAGFLSSGWGNFVKKVSINNLEFTNFKKEFHDNEYTVTNRIIVGDKFYENAQEFSVSDVDLLLSKYKRHDHPYILLAHFLKPFLMRGLILKINRGANSIIFSYKPKYTNNKSSKQYMSELKAVKDFDKHFDFYIEQIKRFMDKFVYPYLENFAKDDNHSYGIPENIKLPLLQVKNRKDSELQTMLDFHEKRDFSSFFHKMYFT